MSDISRPKVGVGVMILKDNKVLLGKRHGDPEKADSELHGEGTWTMPGGKLEYKEGLEEAVIREVLEETGVTLEKSNIIQFNVSNDIVEDAHFVTIGFLCNVYPGEPKVMEPDEITEWKWFDLQDLPEKIFFPSEKILRKFLKK